MVVIGPSGWTRTTTSRVKSPACFVHTTKGYVGANGRTRLLDTPRSGVVEEGRSRSGRPTDTARLGRPAGRRYPTFAFWFGLRDSNPYLHVGTMGCCLHTQAEQTRRLFTDVSDILQLSKSPFISNRLVGSKGFEPNRPSSRRTGLQPASGPSARTARLVLATVPGFEPGLESFGGSRAPVTPHCRSRLASFLDAALPSDLARDRSSVEAKNKKAF